jgi:S1-C subfamily serine protease
MSPTPRADRPLPALRAARSRTAAVRAARSRTAAVRAARSRTPAVRAVALLVLLALAALVASATLLRAGSAPAPAAAIEPLRVASGHAIATGFAVADGRVVTVAHVLDGPVTVHGHGVRVLRVDRPNDLALLSVPGLGSGAPGLGSGAPGLAIAANGEHLRVLRIRAGHSSSLSVHVRRSIVAHVRASGSARAVVRPALELAARVASGDSGAPVVTEDGALAGVVFAASRNRPQTAYAVDADAVKQLLERTR